MLVRQAKALIFDVDGTLAETEELHRQAFNRAFAVAGVDFTWNRELYGELLGVTGGRRRILSYFERRGMAIDDAALASATQLHAAKNRHYAEAMAGGAIALRPGVARVVAEARESGIKVAIATTTGRSNLTALLDAVAATLPRNSFDVVVTGEDVTALKPDPEAYVLALRRLGLPAAACLAFEDSEVGLRAAVGAGIATIVTPSLYTRHQDFSLALAVLPDGLG